MGITAFPFGSVIDVPTARILGRDDAGTGSAEALTATEIFAILGTGTPSASTYLRGDGTWSTVTPGVGGSTGSVDNAVLRADGTGGATLQASGVTISDSFVIRVGTGITNPGRIQLQDSGQYSTNQMLAVFLGGFFNGQDIAAFEVLGNGNATSVGVIAANSFVSGIYTLQGGWGQLTRATSMPTGQTGNRLENTNGFQITVGANHGVSITSGANPTFLHVHNTFVSSTSFERLNIAWASNVCYIGTEKGSAGGTARDLTLGTDGVVRAVFPAATTSGAFYLGPRADSTATGGNARGANAVDLSTLRGSSSSVASGTSAFLGSPQNGTASGSNSAVVSGVNGTASGAQSFVGAGLNNTTSAAGAFIGAGAGNAASGTYSAIPGGEQNTASANYTLACGLQAVANRQAMRAHSGGQFAVNGDCQLGEIVLRGSTTTNAAVRLRPDGSSQRLTIASGQVCQFLLIVTGVRNGGADVASYMRQVTIKNIGGTTSLVGTVNTIGTDNAAGTSLSVTADDTNDDLAVEPTGVSGQTWRWQCIVYGGELRHGT